MRVLVTGSRGFIGKNLLTRLREQGGIELLEFVRGDAADALESAVATVDAVVHLAGENRPKDPTDFIRNNAELSERLCQAINRSGRPTLLILASSAQAALDNDYGRSKRAAEIAAERLGASGSPVVIYRLPGVFGKWCRPNYNSVVATFCHNIANELPIDISDPGKTIRLVYIDDVVDDILRVLGERREAGAQRRSVAPEYSVTVGGLAAQIRAFESSRAHLITERVGEGLVRALYSTYVSHLPPSRFTYDLPCHSDERGVFVEMLKTPDCGQFSYFTAHPGVTRGGHYHHSKTEKFLVVRGSARFVFRHILTDETYVMLADGEKPRVVETIPGWAHAVTNIGKDELVVMTWANEVLDRAHPDTTQCKV